MIISDSADISEDVDFFFVVFGPCYGKFDELALNLTLEVGLRSLPHFLGVNVAYSNELEFREIKGDILQFHELDELELEALYFAYEANKFLLCGNLTPHILFILFRPIQSRHILAVESYFPFFDFLPYLVGLALFNLIGNFLIVKGWE